MYPYPQLSPPSFIWQSLENTQEPKVHEWIKTLSTNGKKVNWNEIDATILGVPLSRSSISASAASENPKAMRQAWPGFNSYNLDYDVNLTDLNVVDLGDVRQHVTDIALCHENIKEAMVSMQTHHPHTLSITLGGDHSITAMLIKGWKEVHKNKKIGILQFDTHFDLRDLNDDGPCNGTPIRNLIESNVTEGKDIWNIGLHGYYNSRHLKQYADQEGVNYVTMRDARLRGVQNVVEEALEDLSSRVDVIYMTVDMDVLDIAFGPGVPSSTPGGMYTDELFHAVYIAGSHEKVRALDIVCLDPHKDIHNATVKSGVHVMLNFLSGKVKRAENPPVEVELNNKGENK